MSNIGPITDSYIDGIIKSNPNDNPDANTTQGADLRVLVKLLRDRSEQGDTDLENAISSIGGSLSVFKGEWAIPTNNAFPFTLPMPLS